MKTEGSPGRTPQRLPDAVDMHGHAEWKNEAHQWHKERMGQKSAVRRGNEKLVRALRKRNEGDSHEVKQGEKPKGIPQQSLRPPELPTGEENIAAHQSANAYHNIIVKPQEGQLRWYIPASVTHPQQQTEGNTNPLHLNDPLWRCDQNDLPEKPEAQQQQEENRRQQEKAEHGEHRLGCPVPGATGQPDADQKPDAERQNNQPARFFALSRRLLQPAHANAQRRIQAAQQSGGQQQRYQLADKK